jgi:hypothetical protein
MNAGLMSLASALRYYALQHDDRLPASLEQMVEERYLQSVDRVADAGGPYPVYSSHHWTGPIRYEYRGAGFSMKSRGAVVLYCEYEGETFCWVVPAEGEHLRLIRGSIAAHQ